jgi:hypothetical protein
MNGGLYRLAAARLLAALKLVFYRAAAVFFSDETADFLRVFFGPESCWPRNYAATEPGLRFRSRSF